MQRPLYRFAALAGASTILAACALVPPEPASVATGASRDQVQRRLGAPSVERRLPDGRTAWYYTTAPSGFTTWRAVFGPAGTVQEYRQVLTGENFEWMRAGATREEVLDRVGPPMERMHFARTDTEAWTYRWRQGTLEMIAQPVFDARSGRVREIGIFRDPAFSSTMGGGLR